MNNNESKEIDVEGIYRYIKNRVEHIEANLNEWQQLEQFDDEFIAGRKGELRGYKKLLDVFWKEDV